MIILKVFLFNTWCISFHVNILARSAILFLVSSLRSGLRAPRRLLLIGSNLTDFAQCATNGIIN